MITISTYKSEQQLGRVHEEIPVQFDKLPQLVCAKLWSPGTFNLTEEKTKDGVVRRTRKRTKATFKSVDLAVFDVDGNCTLEQAKEIFRNFTCFILTTRNHQKIKNPGTPSEQPACDRFRVIVLLDRPITDNETYDHNWRAWAKRFPFLDKACKDSSRFYFPKYLKPLAKDRLRRQN